MRNRERLTAEERMRAADVRSGGGQYGAWAQPVEPIGYDAAAFDGKKRRRRLVAIAIIAVAAVAAVGIANAVFDTAQDMHIQQEKQAFNEAVDAVDEDTIASSVATQADFMAGVASNDYTDGDAYQVKSVTIEDKTSDKATGTMDVFASIVIENSFFHETANLDLTYEQEDGGSLVLSDLAASNVQVVPIRGISRDEEHGISGASPELVENNQGKYSCEYQGDITNRYWFGTTTANGDVEYKFDETSHAWTVDDTSFSNEKFATVEGMVGDYIDKRDGPTETHGQYNAFTIEGADAQTGEVTINYTHTSMVGGDSKNSLNGETAQQSGKAKIVFDRYDNQTGRVYFEASDESKSNRNVAGNMAVRGYIDKDSIALEGGTMYANYGGDTISLNADVTLYRPVDNEAASDSASASDVSSLSASGASEGSDDSE